jgi:hypothetical protein
MENLNILIDYFDNAFFCTLYCYYKLGKIIPEIIAC